MSARWHRLLFAFLLLSLMASGCRAELLRIERASFTRMDRTDASASASASTPLPVALPDTWTLRGEPAPGVGRYVAELELAAPPSAMWALRFDRLNTFHEVRVNGALVHGTLAAGPGLRRPVPTLVTLPPGLLHAGRNELVIDIDAGARAGMSTIVAGPEAELSSGFLWSHHRAVTLPQLLNVAGAGTALLMLLLWWLRRSEVAIGSFGALGLLTSLRNNAYFTVGSALPTALTDWLYFAAQAASAALLGVFAMAFAERRPAPYRAALAATALLVPLGGAAAAWAGELHRARAWVYPWLLAISLPALALILEAARRRRSATEVTLVAGLVVVLAAGAHDYLYQQGYTSVMDTYWMPYAVPVVMAIFSALLLKRMVAALEGVERLNVTLERRVAERTRELQVANRAKTRFLAAASHDLRQPMVSIGLLAGLLREQVQGTPLARVVARLQEATGAMEGLLKRLLDLSRLESGAVRVHRQPIALQTVFDAIAAHHAEQALRKGLRLVVRPTRAVVDGDPALLEQILRNLVGNAVRYTDGGGVLLGARRAGAAWRIEVWDSGPGIAEHEREAVFGEFVRGAAAREDDGASGLGLGLAIVQRSAALLGAPVSLRSRPGRGSCFAVTLPAAQQAPQAAEAPAARDAAALAGRRVWLLEDDAGARHSMQLLLSHHGLEVTAFAAVAALRRAAEAGTAPDLVISDQRLPDGRGTEVLAWLRQRWPALPAVIVTADTAPPDLARLETWRDAGVPVLTKPFEADALVDAALAALSAEERR